MGVSIDSCVKFDANINKFAKYQYRDKNLAWRFGKAAKIIGYLKISANSLAFPCLIIVLISCVKSLLALNPIINSKNNVPKNLLISLAIVASLRLPAEIVALRYLHSSEFIPHAWNSYEYAKMITNFLVCVGFSIVSLLRNVKPIVLNVVETIFFGNFLWELTFIENEVGSLFSFPQRTSKFFNDYTFWVISDLIRRLISIPNFVISFAIILIFFQNSETQKNFNFDANFGKFLKIFGAVAILIGILILIADFVLLFPSIGVEFYHLFHHRSFGFGIWTLMIGIFFLKLICKKKFFHPKLQYLMFVICFLTFDESLIPFGHLISLFEPLDPNIKEPVDKCENDVYFEIGFEFVTCETPFHLSTFIQIFTYCIFAMIASIISICSMWILIRLVILLQKTNTVNFIIIIFASIYSQRLQSYNKTTNFIVLQ